MSMVAGLPMHRVETNQTALPLRGRSPEAEGLAGWGCSEWEGISHSINKTQTCKNTNW